MKFNVTVDLDLVDEESTIDSAVKDELVSSIKKKNLEEVGDKIESDFKAIIKDYYRSIDDRSDNRRLIEDGILKGMEKS